jgi:NADH-quinone oxidoreductase subunit N
VKVAVLGLLLQLLLTALLPLQAMWQPLIVVGAAASLVWGCFGAVSERRTKRFLAFASINQIGFLLIGLATASFDGYRAIVFYLIVYIAINIGLLIIFLNAQTETRLKKVSLTYLTDFRGFGKTYTQYSWALSIILFSIAGIPPLAGYFGKYHLLLHAHIQGLDYLVIIGLVTSLISAFYYLKLIKLMWFESRDIALDAPSVCILTSPQKILLYTSEWVLWGAIFYSGYLLVALESTTTAAFGCFALIPAIPCFRAMK